jgi:hypothetical protein
VLLLRQFLWNSGITVEFAVLLPEDVKVSSQHMTRGSHDGVGCELWINQHCSWGYELNR